MIAVILILYVPSRRGRAVAFSYLMIGLLRYRTEELPTRDLTYLLIVIAVSMVNAVANFGVAGLLLLNGLLVLGTALAQMISSVRREDQYKLIYERVELIRPERRSALLRDLSERLGIQAVRVEVGQIDFMRNTVLLSVWCAAPRRVSGATQTAPGTVLDGHD